MLMPIGKFKGQPVAAMSTGYLCWLVSQEHLRWGRWPLVREALAILKARFQDLDAMEEALRLNTQPPEYWKKRKAEREAAKAVEQAEKLRQLETQRAEERERRRAERRRKYQEGQAAVLDEIAARHKERNDAFYVARAEKTVEDLL